MKYQCQNPTCQHVFDGDFSTTVCPKCGCEDIKEKNNKHKWVIPTIVVIAIIVIILLLIKCCNRNNVVITASLNINNDYGTVTVVINPTKSTINDNENYKVLVLDTLDSMYIERQFRYKKNKNSITFDMNDFEGEGVTYTFKILPIGGKSINVKWDGPCTYTTPTPPHKPEFTIGEPIPNYQTKIYTIPITITLGTMDKATLGYFNDGGAFIESENITSLEFTNVKPRKERYYIFVIDVNGLSSDTINTPLLSPIEPKTITQGQVKNYFEQFNNGTIDFEIIDKLGCGNLRLSPPVHGCSTLEDLLVQSRTEGFPIHVVNANIQHSGCKDIVVGLTLR